MNSETSPPSSIPTLLRDLRDETTTLLRQEVALAKTELKENMSRLGGHATRIAIGGFVAYAGVIVLLIGLGHLLGALLIRAGLSAPLAQWLAPSIVGLLVPIIGWVMLSRAKQAIAHDDLAPRQTIDSLRTSKQWAQTKLNPSS
ncbi:MAG: phage holin family protein [Opitutaceae bacterium]